MDFASFKSGNDDHRPLALWSLNHALQEEEMTRQIAEMAGKGLQGFIMHARSGLLTPYLSEKWFQALEHAICEAQKQGLQAWLYDEDPYPSGVAGGKVTADRPEYRAQTLGVARGQVQGPGRLSMDIPLRRLEYAAAVRLEHGAIAETRDLMSQIGILRTHWQQYKRYHTYYPTTDSKPAPQYRSDTEDPFYRLEWDAPAGDWRVFVFHSGPYGKYWLFDSYTDLLNPDAVAYFMETTYLPYERRFGQYFGTVIPGIFVDEPKFISSPYPWTSRLPEEFMARRGYPILDALLALELDIPGAARKRRDFWDVVGELFNESYTEQISRWCRRNGLKLIGHSSPEEEPCDQVEITGDLMRFMKRMDIPGTDLITYQIGDRRHPIVNLGPKLAASVSRQWKDGRALCEAYGVMEWQLDLSGMAWIADWLFALGVNIVVPHTFIYSIDGMRKKDAAPSEFYQAPYWEHFKAYSDHLATLGALLGDATPCAGTALLYPFDSFEALHGRAGSGGAALRDRFVWLFNTLLRGHVQFELVDTDDLTAAPVEGGCLCVGRRRYRQVILPPLAYVSEALEAALGRLATGGVYTAAPAGTDTAFAESPDAETALSGISALQSASARYTVSGDAARGFEASGLQPVLDTCADEMELLGTGACDVFLNHSEKGGRHVFFLFNSGEHVAKLEIRMRLSREISLERWDERCESTVPMKADNSGTWHITVPPLGSAVLVTGGMGTQTEALHLSESYDIPLSGTWQATPGRRNILLLDRWVLDTSPVADPGEIDFRSGLPVVVPGPLETAAGQAFPRTLWYKTVVRFAGTPGRMALVLEKSAINGDYQIYCNGLPCGPGVPVNEYDCNNIEIPLPAAALEARRNHFYQKDEVVIAVRVHANIPDGGLMEPLRLFGDFRVKLNAGESIGAALDAVEYPTSLVTGSWMNQGYPHYSGMMLYEQDVEIKKVPKNSRYTLRFNIGSCSAEVFVNGVSAGITAWEPYEADITGLVGEGMNRIGIRVANTLEPLLYGTGKPAGMLGPAFIRVSTGTSA